VVLSKELEFKKSFIGSSAQKMVGPPFDTVLLTPTFKMTMLQTTSDLKTQDNK